MPIETHKAESMLMTTTVKVGTEDYFAKEMNRQTES
jgi:hypothetical protein